jgi:hypothetical protein
VTSDNEVEGHETLEDATAYATGLVEDFIGDNPDDDITPVGVYRLVAEVGTAPAVPVERKPIVTAVL